MMKIISQFIKIPTSCVICQQSTASIGNICSRCKPYLPKIKQACVICRRPMGTDSRCGECLTNPPAFDKVICDYLYHPPLTNLVMRYKYHEHLMLSIFFANLLIEAVEKHYVHKLMPQCLIPVPLHKTRLKERGFNQALEIAKQIAPSYYLPIDYYTCQRIKETQSQSLLPAKERHKNIAKAFAAQPLPYSHVAIIDDVLTTGSTVNAMSMALKKQGVERIDIWTCTRTPL